MKHVISLNGLDQSGKTTQAERIKEHYGLAHVVGKLKRYDVWPKLEGKAYFNWGFREGPTEEFVRIIYKSLTQRNKEIKETNAPLLVLDRGNHIFDSVCVATTAVREEWPAPRAKDFVMRIRKDYDLPNPAGLDIFLLHGDTPEEMFRVSFEREDLSNLDETSRAIYQRYQGVLANVLGNQINSGDYPIVRTDGPQEQVFERVRKRIDNTIRGSLNLSSIERIVGLGGLSECGKSTFGRHLEKKGFQRIKIGDIIDKIGERYSQITTDLQEGAYSSDPNFLAGLFLEELTQENSPEIVVESLHRFQFTAGIKRVLGNRFQIVYIETPRKIRIERESVKSSIELQESEKEVDRKDRVKTDREADKIRGIADLVIDNSGELDYSINQLNTALRLK